MTESPTTGGDYWAESKRPVTALCFLAPLLIAYEIGAWVSPSDPALRSGVDALLRAMLLRLSFGHLWILPALVAACLIAWQAGSRQNWKFRLETLGGMFAESLVFALLLVILGQGMHIACRKVGLIETTPPTGESPERWASDDPQITLAITEGGTPAESSVESVAESQPPIPKAPIAIAPPSEKPLVSRIMGYLGAGIYEEFVFRLLLLPVLYGGLRVLRWASAPAAVAAVIVSSVVFAAAHYLPAGEQTLHIGTLAESMCRVARDQSLWFGFLFRTAAGAVFSSLFVVRGFGVTVGSHALYDLIVGVILAA